MDPGRTELAPRREERAPHSAERGGSNETPKERIDRELIELLNGLRVALPGVQVLFAFLLTVPFSQRFGQLTDLQRGVYFATLFAAAGSSVMFITPSSYHRLTFRMPEKERLLRTANRLAIAGFALLAAAMSGSLYVIADMTFAAGCAVAMGAAAAGLFAWFWFVLPTRRRRQHEREVPRTT